MVGYKTPEYINIGWYSARSDDVFNYIPERLTTILMIPSISISRQNSRNAFKILKRDRNKIESVNAGWSMSCMAGALEVQLEKPGIYQLGDPLKRLKASHIKVSLKIIYITLFLFLIFICAFTKTTGTTPYCTNCLRFARRHIHQIMKAVSIIITAAIKTGRTIARIEKIVEMTSSMRLTGTFPVPPVVAVTAGRTATDFAA